MVVRCYKMFSWGYLYTNNPQLSPSCGLIAMVILSNYIADVKLGWICPTFFGIMAMVLWWCFLMTSTAPPAPNQEGEGPTEELAEVGFFHCFPTRKTGWYPVGTQFWKWMDMDNSQLYANLQTRRFSCKNKTRFPSERMLITITTGGYTQADAGWSKGGKPTTMGI